METKIHVGRMISKRIEETGIKRTTLAVRMGLPNTAIYAYEKRSSLQLQSLLHLSDTLRYNFFMDIAMRLPADYASDNNSPKDTLLAEQAEQIRKLQWENELLKELIKGK